MEIRIQAIHFEIAERLEAFINKKVERLARRNDSISEVDVTLKVVKPESAMNKEVVLKVFIPQHEDVIAEAVDLAIEAAERQLDKFKQKR